MEVGMQQRVDAAVAENEIRTKGLREASEKNVHFSARVVALNSRLQTVQKQLKETQGREKMLLDELDTMRQASKTAPLAAGNGIPNGNFHTHSHLLPPPPRHFPNPLTNHLLHVY